MENQILKNSAFEKPPPTPPKEERKLANAGLQVRLRQKLAITALRSVGEDLRKRGLTPLVQAQTLVHEIIHTYLCYKKYILKENVNPSHVNNAPPYTASNPQTEGNTLLNTKLESHMHRTFTLNPW